MNKKPGTSKDAADKLVRGIKRKTRKHYSSEEKIRIVAGLLGEESIAALCRREGIAEMLTGNDVSEPIRTLNPSYKQWIPLPDQVVDLSRDCAAPFTTYRVAKENTDGITTNPGIPRRSSACSVDERLAA